jgi:hypothetical protein
MTHENANEIHNEMSFYQLTKMLNFAKITLQHFIKKALWYYLLKLKHINSPLSRKFCSFGHYI